MGDVKYEGLSASADAIYEPLTEGWAQSANVGLNLFVRTAGPPDAVIDRVRAALRSVDPGIPLKDVVSMDQRIYASIAQPRHLTMLLGGFALTAVALAAVGIFGMLSYTVSARRREIGLVAALVGTRWLAGALFNMSATDPATLAGVTLLLLAVALIACWIPARRAASIDPTEAIRAE